MTRRPLISIVTPSFNQGNFLGETLQSLLDQNYPNLEVIIQDGSSTDDSISIAQEFVQRHPAVFQLFVEKDEGQADALNRGFARAKGEILGFLNSDDTLFPGCLESVAQHIEPSKKRLIVFGRCLFTGEGSPYVGVEHPAAYESHFELLAIWKRGYNNVPQPSVFWHRRVWEKCGGFDATENHVLDFDLFCRFSRYFFFHRVDELWSTYRMHPSSKSSQRTEDEVLDLSIHVSRRHWGPLYFPLYWRCRLSHWLHNRHLHERARHHARRAEEAAQAGRRLVALREFCQTLAYSPFMARDRLLRAWLSAYRLKFIERMLLTDDEGFTGHYGDQWIGPLYRANVEIPADAEILVFTLKHSPHGNHAKVAVTLAIDGKKTARHEATMEGPLKLTANVKALRGRRCRVEIRSNIFFVPRFLHNTPDDRQLSLQLLSTEIIKTRPS